MNKERRSKLAKLQRDLTLISTTFNKEKLSEYISDLDDIRSDEEMAFDSMPEGLQCSMRGMAAEEAIEYMDEALAYLEEAVDAETEDDFEDAVESAISCLEDAESV